MLTLDHITVGALSLDDGIAFASAALGVSIPAGGAHRQMATHNHLLRLGDGLFLEVIAPDPSATVARPRWFGLDDARMRAALQASPRLVTWAVRTPDIGRALETVPGARGPAIRLTRGMLSWLITVPDDGSMAFDGAFPTIIEWPAGPHPTSDMQDLGCSLVRLDVQHPQGAVIAAYLSPFFNDERVTIGPGAEARLSATIRTPNGERTLR